MKYLIKFFESFGNPDIKEELQSFCNENLAYLIDEGYEVRIIWTPNCDAWRIKFIKTGQKYPDLKKVERSRSFYWRDIKDDFIPFFEVLDEKYELCGTFNKEWVPSYQKDEIDELVIDFETPMFITEHAHFFYKKEQLLSGKTTNKKISTITIYVKLKNHS